MELAPLLSYGRYLSFERFGNFIIRCGAEEFDFVRLPSPQQWPGRRNSQSVATSPDCLDGPFNPLRDFCVRPRAEQGYLLDCPVRCFRHAGISFSWATLSQLMEE